jgi:predicted PurR-regulated permease PerM
MSVGDEQQPDVAPSRRRQGSGPSAERAPVLLVDLDWRSVAAVLALLVALALLVGAVRTASMGVTLIVVALFVAMALDPLVVRLQRMGLGRGVAVLGVVVLLGAAFGLFVAFAGPQLVAQTRELGTELPRTVDSLRDLPLIGPHLVEWGVPEKITEFLSSLPERIGQQDADLGQVAKGVGFGVGTFLLGLLVTIGALLEGPRLVDTVRGAVPAAGRDRADAIGRIVDSVIGRYFAGSLLIALLNGIWVSVWALVAGAPLSPVLGVWAALTSLIPQIGGLMGFAVVVLVSLAAGVLPALIMTVTFLVFMLVTNHVLQPTIVGRAVQLSAPVTMLAAISGFTVGGIVGALFAVPTIGAIKAVLRYVRDPDEPPPTRPDHPSRFGWDRFVHRFRRRRGHADHGSGATAAAATTPGTSVRGVAGAGHADGPPPAWFSSPG